MSNDTDKAGVEANSSSDTADAMFEDLGDSATVAPDSSPPRQSRAPLLVAILAVLIASVALFGVVALFLADDKTPSTAVDDSAARVAVDALDASIGAQRESLRELEQRLASLASRDNVTIDDLDELARSSRRQLEDYESLPGRLQNIENTVSSIQGISTGVRDHWLIAEAEYYMQIANAQLQLAGNPELARLALLQADERVQQLANPALTNVRRTIAGEMGALKSMQRADIEGISLQLGSLASSIEALPLRRDVQVAEVAENVSADDEISGVDRAVASLKSTVSNVVSIRRTDENIRPLIAPESAYFLRANLSLQLQAARLALLRSEKAAYQQSLDDASGWLQEYYDQDAPQVLSAIQTIAEIRGGLVDVSVPDISQSLRLLRQYETMATSASPAVNSDAVSNAPPQQPISTEETSEQ